MKQAALNYLYSGHLFCTDEEHIKFKIIFLNSVISFSILITLLMGVYRYAHHNSVVSIIDFTFAVIATLLLFALRQKKERIEMIATILLIAAFVLFLTIFLFAPMQSTRLSLFFLLVASAFYLKGLNTGIYWLIIVIASIGVIHFGGWVQTGYSDLDIIALYIYLFSFYIILRLYESVKMSHMRSLIDINSNLEDLVNRRTEELRREKELLKIASATDPLTQLCNRMKMEEVFLSETAVAGRDFSLILMDLDHFKRVNDTHGHNIGDSFLKEVAALLKGTFRESDTIGRWGGEEFLIFLPRTPLKEAQMLAEQLRECFATFPFEHIGTQSASFGVAQRLSSEPLKSLIHRADNALYLAKKHRNRVVVDG